MDIALLGAGGVCVSLSRARALSLSWGEGQLCVKVNHTLSMLHGPASSRNATAMPSIADQYVSDHLYDYLCMSRVVPWRGRRWVFDGSWAGRRKNEETKGTSASAVTTLIRFASRAAQRPWKDPVRLARSP